jgi:hypothetical protein
MNAFPVLARWSSLLASMSAASSYTDASHWPRPPIQHRHTLRRRALSPMSSVFLTWYPVTSIRGPSTATSRERSLVIQDATFAAAYICSGPGLTPPPALEVSDCISIVAPLIAWGPSACGLIIFRRSPLSPRLLTKEVLSRKRFQCHREGQNEDSRLV